MIRLFNGATYYTLPTLGLDIAPHSLEYDLRNMQPPGSIRAFPVGSGRETNRLERIDFVARASTETAALAELEAVVAFARDATAIVYIPDGTLTWDSNATTWDSTTTTLDEGATEWVTAVAFKAGSVTPILGQSKAWLCTLYFRPRYAQPTEFLPRSAAEYRTLSAGTGNTYTWSDGATWSDGSEWKD